MTPSSSSTAFLSGMGLLLGATIVVGLQRPSSAQDRCQGSIAFVKNDIEGRLGARIFSVRVESAEEFRERYRANISPRPPVAMMQQFRPPFQNADQIVTYTLYTAPELTPRQNQAAANIINSPRLTRSYAERVIAACSRVASVKFSYWERYEGWSLYPGNVLRQDRCKLLDNRARFLWGENPCL